MVKIEVELEDAKAVLDIAVGSMNFGSGFLDRDEVASLRRLAEQIGIDPIIATPEAWRLQYAHVWTPVTKTRYHHDQREGSSPAHPYGHIPTTEYIGCEYCPQAEDDLVHHGQDALTSYDTAKDEQTASIYQGRRLETIPEMIARVDADPTNAIGVGDTASATVERA